MICEDVQELTSYLYRCDDRVAPGNYLRLPSTEPIPVDGCGIESGLQCSGSAAVRCVSQ